MITERQERILRHALGLDSTEVGGRNYYFARRDSIDFPDLEALVEAGMMTRHARDWPPDVVYRATDAGKRAVGAKLNVW